MTVQIGLELTEDRIRAVTVSRFTRSPRETFEIRWDPRAPRDAVLLLRQQLGQVAAIGLSIGLAFLHAKHIQLPPVSSEERRGILTLEPDRFFAIESEEIAVSTQGDSDLVFAADAARVDSWVSAFEEWGPVVVIEPAPASAVRVIGLSGVSSGVFEISSAGSEKGIIELDEGALVSARLVDDVSTSNARPLPAARGVSREFALAYGVALGSSAPLDDMLLSAAAARRIRSRRRTGFARAAVTFALALAFVVISFDRSRARVLERAQREIAQLAPRVEGPASLEARMAQLDLESSAVRSAGTAHPDPVAVIAAISRRLPRDAVVMSLRADGDQWEIDGTARDAASIVPALDADPSLENVHFLSASSRFNEGNRTYETFSVALHARR